MPFLLACAAVGTALLWWHGNPTYSLDWHTHVFWLQSYTDGLLSRTFPPRWVASANSGYGAPIFIFYAPLTYLLAAPWVWLYSAGTALMLSYTSSLALLAWSSYRWLRLSASRAGACTGAALIALSPWALCLIYRWNMPAGLLGFACIPLVLWRFTRLLHATKAWQSCAVSYALLCLAHLPSAFMLTLVLIPLLWAMHARSTTRFPLGRIVLCLGAGAVLSAFYLGPVVTERSWVHAGYALLDVWDWSRHFLFSPRTSHDGIFAFLPFLDRVALGCALLTILGLAATRYPRSRQAQVASIRWVMIALMLCACLLTPLGRPLYVLWEPLRYLQFPWRWLWLLSLATGLSAALWVDRCTQRKSKAFWLHAVALGMACLPLGYFALQAQGFHTGNALPALAWTTPEMVREAARRPLQDTVEHRPATFTNNWDQAINDRNTARATATPADHARFTNLRFAPHRREWRIHAATAVIVTFRLFDYPGWSAACDGKEMHPLANDGSGTLRYALEAGVHRCTLTFARTPLRLFFELLSVVGWVSLLMACVFSRMRGKNAPFNEGCVSYCQ